MQKVASHFASRFDFEFCGAKMEMITFAQFAATFGEMWKGLLISKAQTIYHTPAGPGEIA